MNSCCSGGDALARCTSSCFGLKDKKSGLEALGLKQSLIFTLLHSWVTLKRRTLKWARAPWKLFVRHVFRRKLIHDSKFEASRNRAERGLDIFGRTQQ